MAVTGRVFAVTNLEALFDSYVSQPNAPEPETLAPLPNARVQLRSGLPHIPLSAEAVTGGDGTSAHDRRGLPVAALAGRNTDLPAGHDSADRGWAVA